MTREDFRRELGNAFDEISGSPSPALSDRVRSSLAEAPERRGPVWIAGLAAAVIAFLLVGVLVVANPLNRPRSSGPGPIPTPTSTPNVSPASSPSSAPSSTPDASLPAFLCVGSNAWAPKPTTPPQPPVAFIDRVQTGSHTGYERLTIEFNNGEPNLIEIKPQSGTTFTQGASGQPVVLAGQAGILVTIHGADAHTAYSGPIDFKTGYPVMVEVRQVQDFEGVVQFAIGLSNAACYRGFILLNPARLVIDIQAP